MAARMISQVKLYYQQIKETFEELGIVTLNLEADPQIQCVLDQGFDIGRAICRKECESFPISSVEDISKECQIEMVDIVKIIGPDEKCPYYTGVTCLEGGQVMLADHENKSVILVNSSYRCIANFTLPDRSWDICVVSQHEVVVSLPFQKSLQFLSVTSRAIKPTRKVQTRYECWGVATAGKEKLVVSGDCDDEGEHYWSVINSTGEEELCHTFDCLCSPSTTCVALNSSCTCVYIIVWMANSLYCFDMDGRMLYHYNPNSLKGPTGVASDRDDNVYMVGRWSKNIHQLTSGGTPIRIITDGIPRSLIATCFNRVLDRFLATNGVASESVNIYMFRLK